MTKRISWGISLQTAIDLLQDETHYIVVKDVLWYEYGVFGVLTTNLKSDCKLIWIGKLLIIEGIWIGLDFKSLYANLINMRAGVYPEILIVKKV